MQVFELAVFIDADFALGLVFDSSNDLASLFGVAISISVLSLNATASFSAPTHFPELDSNSTFKFLAVLDLLQQFVDVLSFGQGQFIFAMVEL